MSNKEVATKIQQFLDWEYGIDIAAFQNSELKRMATEIQKFLALGVETEDLEPADGDTGSEADELDDIDDEDFSEDN